MADWCVACHMRPATGCGHPLGPQYCPHRPLPPDWQDADFSGCFWLAVADAKERVARGEPLPEWLKSTREEREG